MKTAFAFATLPPAANSHAEPCVPNMHQVIARGNSAPKNDANEPGLFDSTIIDLVGPKPSATLVYDVSYISHLSVDHTTAITGGSIGVVVNTGSAPLDLSTAKVVSVSADHAVARFELYVHATDTVLSAGQGGGGLSPLASDFIVDTGMVGEVVTTQQFVIGYKLLNLPAGQYTVNAKAVLDIGGAQITLPMTFNVDTAGRGFGVSFVAASRLSSN